MKWKKSIITLKKDLKRLKSCPHCGYSMPYVRKYYQGKCDGQKLTFRQYSCRKCKRWFSDHPGRVHQATLELISYLLDVLKPREAEFYLRTRGIKIPYDYIKKTKPADKVVKIFRIEFLKDGYRLECQKKL